MGHLTNRKGNSMNPANNPERWRPNPWSIIVAIILLLPYAVSFGSDGATFTLVNATHYYLHVVVNGEGIAYIPPSYSLTRQSDDLYAVVVEVRLSPGQGKKGSAFRTFQTVVHTSETSSESSTQTNDCSDGSNTNTCDSNTGVNSERQTSVTVEPVTWIVNDDTLGVH